MTEVSFVPESEIGDFVHPWSAMVCGVSGSGKTVFLSKIIKESLRKKWATIYVTCKGYRIEEEAQITALRDEHSDLMCIAQASDMGESTIIKIKKLLASLPYTQPKHLIFDNFTYDLSESLLNFLTINRKLNTSVTLLMHDLFSNPKLGPRLRGTLKYSVLFYLGSNVNNLRFFLTSDVMKDEYLENVKFKNFKKLIWKNQENTACIADPDFAPKLQVDKNLVPKDDEVIFEDMKFSELFPAKGKASLAPSRPAGPVATTVGAVKDVQGKIDTGQQKLGLSLVPGSARILSHTGRTNYRVVRR